ncbi:MAG: hypothetical protein KC589_02925 [Nanoarchaeota archaeon]|nr:hypothetical protein [Nanoarchaeota archaeon]
MSKCTICEKEAFYKVKNEKIFYCRKHAEEFFSLDYLEKIDSIKVSQKQANILKKFIDKN